MNGVSPLFATLVPAVTLVPAAVVMLMVVLLQVHLGLLEGRVSHIVWPPSRMGRVEVLPQPERILHSDTGADGVSKGYS